MKTLFGTDGMRGEAGQFPLDAATVRIVGSSLARHLAEVTGRTPRIVIGRDTRESGDWLETALVQGAAAAGGECHSAGIITTPGVAFLTRVLPADAGVVISASHNPYHDNGIKIFSPSGRKLDESIERQIEADIYAGAADSTATDNGRAEFKEDSELHERYLNFLADEIGNGLSLRGLTLVVDTANGAASSFAPVLLERLGAKIVAINNRPDGRNINKDAGSLHIEGLCQRVVAEKADLGVAYDGDADRSLFVDSAGKLVDGDATLWVLAKYFQSRNQLNNNIVVATVMSNIGLELALKSQGITLVRTDVGDKFVLDELIRLDASVGGEQSGHIIIPRLSLAGDGMISTLCLLRAIQEAGKSLNELTQGFERYPQILVNVIVAAKRPFDEVEGIRKVKQEVDIALEGKGRLLLRYSGTEPLARVMIEGQSQGEIEAHAQRLANVIRAELGAQ
jgi:phosphoglucosamine mutase